MIYLSRSAVVAGCLHLHTHGFLPQRIHKPFRFLYFRFLLNVAVLSFLVFLFRGFSSTFDLRFSISRLAVALRHHRRHSFISSACSLSWPSTAPFSCLQRPACRLDSK